jgi:hypothetical protein
MLDGHAVAGEGRECITRASARPFSPEIEASASKEMNGK